MSQIKVIDNFLSEETFDKISKNIFSDKIPFYVTESTTNEGSTDIYWLSHSIYNDFKPNSDLFIFMSEFFNKLNISSIINIRLNLILKIPYSLIKTNYHIDYDNYQNLKTAIFYFNKDGTGTYFKINNDEKFIESKKNRMVVFDSNISHCAFLNNKFEKRFVLNFNFYQKNG